jgi:NAD(P)-dependent dehydrogenase (short-subunit alcohol dehydrogenase family)
VGGSRGVGAAIANELRQVGWDVFACARRPRINAELDDTVNYAQVNLSTSEGIIQLREHICEVEPSLIVWNAADHGNRRGKISSAEELEEMFRINAFAFYQVVGPALGASDSRRSIVVINSDSMFHANRFSGEYAASKAALRVFSSALADRCRGTEHSVSTLLLGPLRDDRTVQQLEQVAAKTQLPIHEVERQFLQRANPSYVSSKLLDLASVTQTVRHLYALGASANGAMCRLDLGSSGSLI